nr:hypothetical protein [Mesorhizobium muleiense]
MCLAIASRGLRGDDTLAQRVKRAGADVAEDNTKRRQFGGTGAG